MKKLSKMFLSALMCLSIALTAVTPAFAAGVRVKKLKAALITYNAVTLSWQKANGVSGYEVQQFVKKNKWKKVGTTKKAKFTVKKLKTGTTYKFRVVSFKKSGKKVTYSKPSAAVTVKPVCPAPKNLKAAVLSPVSAKLTWKKVNGATNYLVQKYNGKKWVKVASPKANSLTVSKLLPGSATKFRVRAVTRVGKKVVLGKLSKEVSVKTAIATPVLSYVGSTPSSISFKWSKANSATDYVIYKVTGTTYTQVATAKTTAATVSGLSGNTVYRFAIRARVGTALSGYSASLSAKTAPNAVKNLSASAEKSGSVTLRWTDEQNAEKFEIYQVKDGKDVLIATTGKGETEYTVSDLAEQTEYSFKVRAFSSFGGKSLSGELSNAVSAKTLPEGIKDFKVDSSTENSITLSWKAAAGSTAFVLEQSADKKTWTKVADVAAETGKDRVTYTVTGLKASTVLYFRVVTTVGSVFVAGEEVLGKTVPAAPTNLKGSINGQNLLLSWDAVDGAEGYTVKNVSTGKTFEAKTNSYTVSPVISNTEYKFTVSAFVTVNKTKMNGKESNQVSFKAEKLAPVEDIFGYRSKLSENNISVDVIALEWKSTASSFVVERAVPAGASNYVKVITTDKTAATVSEDLKAKQTKKSDYVTTISWNAVPGAKEYIVETTIVSNSADLSSRTVKTKGTSVDLRLAPATEITVLVMAIADSATYRIKATDPKGTAFDSEYRSYDFKNAIVGSSSVRFKTAAAPAFAALNKESQELYTLRLLQAINNTKYEKGTVTADMSSKLNANISGIKIKYKLAGKEREKTFNNIDGLLSFMKIMDPTIDIEDDLTNSLGENSNIKGAVFTNGRSTYTKEYTDSEGKQQTKTVTSTLNNFISPSGKEAYLYDRDNNASFGKGINSVSVSKSGSTDTIVVKLNEESRNTKDSAVFHPGFIDSLTDSLSDLSSVGEGASATASVGPTTLTGKVNAAGTLDSLVVSSDFSLTMGINVGSDIVTSMAFVIKGTVITNYTFKR